jgi:hypothetical protein
MANMCIDGRCTSSVFVCELFRFASGRAVHTLFGQRASDHHMLTNMPIHYGRLCASILDCREAANVMMHFLQATRVDYQGRDEYLQQAFNNAEIAPEDAEAEEVRFHPTSLRAACTAIRFHLVAA